MLTDAEDPLSDAPPAECTRCDRGWCVTAHAEDGSYLGPNPNDPSYAEAVASIATYPCPDCEPKRFLEWKNGCFTRHHRTCDLCKYRRSKRGDLT
jgi:hypothetical protein